MISSTLRASTARLSLAGRRFSSFPAAAGFAGRGSDFPWDKFALYSGLAGAMAWVAADQKEAENCGICAVVSSKDNASDFLMEGLTILQNRGYDSAGIATHSGKKGEDFTVSKFASVGGTADSINLLRADCGKHSGNHVGIAHTRWATHGGKTDENSHPHLDMRNRIAVVHNGTITNYNELKGQLQKEGVTFRSQTDTEVIAQLIGHLIEESGCSVLSAVNQAMSCCEGTWGICVMDKQEPDQVVVARNGSPLVIGYGTNQMYIGSETVAFSRHTKQFVQLQDGETAVIRPDVAELNPQEDEGESISEALMRFPTSRLEKAPDIKIRLTPDPYPHWTIREIIEQPKAIAAALGYGGRLSDDEVYLGGLEQEKDTLLQVTDLLISACGTSLNAGNYGAKLMRQLGCFRTVQTGDAAEMQACNIPRPNGGICVISQSGETKDVHRVLKTAQNLPENVPMFSVINSVGSLIARTTKCGVYTHAGRENAVASTKAFVTQVTVLGLIACWFAQNRDTAKKGKMDELIQSMHRLPITCGMTLRCRKQCKEVAESIRNSEHMFVLGKGFGEPIAHEGALKIKEITYLHAEGYSGGALKHGPFALIEGKDGNFGQTPIIMLVLDDEHAALMKTAAEETRARGANVIVITDNPSMCSDISDHIIPIPNNGPMTALLAVIPLQMIAYELACLRGINPDVPRNLAKAVTVD